MTTVQTEVPPAMRLPVTVRVVAAVTAVAGPEKPPVTVLNVIPAGNVPDREYEEAENPGLGSNWKVCPGWTKSGLTL